MELTRRRGTRARGSRRRPTKSFNVSRAATGPRSRRRRGGVSFWVALSARWMRAAIGPFVLPITNGPIPRFFMGCERAPRRPPKSRMAECGGIEVPFSCTL